MSGLMQEIRAAVRGLRRAPGTAATAILALTLGIGLATAVFTIADALLVRRLPVAAQDRLVLLWGEMRDGRASKVPLTLDAVREFAQRSRSLSGAAFYEFRGAVEAPILVADRVYPMRIGLVSGNYFDVLGSRAAIGRAFRPEDDVAGAAPVVVLSHRAWQQRFGGDSAVVGRSVRMIYTGREYTIIGVMPQGLDYPRGTEVWAPLVAYGSAGGFLDALTGELDVLARLRPGATVEQARDELTGYFARVEAPPRQRDLRGVAHALADEVLGDTKPAMLLVTLAAALLLAITCVNVANILLVRSLARLKEMAVRTALGASRGRVAASSIVEGGVLALAGGVLGTALAAALVKTFIRFAPSGVPRVDEIGVSGTTLLLALGITTATIVLAGSGPALLAMWVPAGEVLATGSRHSGGPRGRRAAEVLVVAQIALATVSLVAAALVARSFIKLEGVGLAFDARELLAVTLVMQPETLSDDQRQQMSLDQVLAKTKALPGVRDVTAVFTVPFVAGGGGIDGHVSAPLQSEAERAGNPIVNLEIAAPNYFAALGIPLLRGRAFTSEDVHGSTPVIIVSSSVASHFWPDADPIGRQLVISKQSLTVMGVVPDTRYRELRVPWPTIYYPAAQSPLPLPSTLLVRTTGAPAALVPAVRQAVSEVPGLAVLDASPIETLLDVPLAQPRLSAMVISIFGFSAVLLAAIGLLAVIAMMVRQRTRELGIRMALGATSGRVRGMVMARGLLLAASGAAIGIGAALGANRLLSSLVFEISPTDGATLAAVAALMLTVAALASFMPARSSTRIDPAIVLRRE